MPGLEPAIYQSVAESFKDDLNHTTTKSFNIFKRYKVVSKLDIYYIYTEFNNCILCQKIFPEFILAERKDIFLTQAFSINHSIQCNIIYIFVIKVAYILLSRTNYLQTS